MAETSCFEDKVNAVRQAYAAGFYEPALALALTLPDICGLIEFPNDSVTKRYITWSNKHIFADNPSNMDENFAGAALYQLRCKFLHEGHSNIQKENGEGYTQVKIEKIELMKSIANGNNQQEMMIQACTWKDDQTQEISYTVKMNLKYLVNEICNAAIVFYEGWNNPSAFENHSVEILEYGTEVHRIKIS